MLEHSWVPLHGFCSIGWDVPLWLLCLGTIWPHTHKKQERAGPRDPLRGSAGPQAASARSLRPAVGGGWHSPSAEAARLTTAPRVWESVSHSLTQASGKDPKRQGGPRKGWVGQVQMPGGPGLSRQVGDGGG